MPDDDPKNIPIVRTCTSTIFKQLTLCCSP